MVHGPLKETSLLVKPLWPWEELPDLGEESKPLGSEESRWFSSQTGSGSCIQKAKVACETTPKHDQIGQGFARSLPGLWKSQVPGKGPACAPLFCFLQTKTTGAVGVPCDRSLSSSLDQCVSCPRGLSVGSVYSCSPRDHEEVHSIKKWKCWDSQAVCSSVMPWLWQEQLPVWGPAKEEDTAERAATHLVLVFLV